MATYRLILRRMRNVLDNGCRENQNTNLCSITFYENLAVYEIMSKIMVEPEGSQMTIQYGACLLHAGQARQQARAHTLVNGPGHPPTHSRTHRARTRREICGSYCFSKATMVSRTRLNIKLYGYCLSCCYTVAWYQGS
jgi:hypothetical protein